MYDYDVLHDINNITRLVLGCFTAATWMLYLHEILFRSEKIQTHQTQWIKKRLGEVGLMLVVALVTILIFSLVTGLQVGHRH